MRAGVDKSCQLSEKLATLRYHISSSPASFPRLTRLSPPIRDESLIDEGITDLVHFTGWVDEADKPTLYSLASLFAFPSLYEGFGLPAAEAAACGTPVLTSNRSSLPEAAPGAILVDPEDVVAIAAGLTQGLAQPTDLPNDSRRNWQTVARQIANLLFKEDL